MKKQKLQLDDWQNRVLETQGNICLRSGRQVGKSFIISIKAGEFAAHNKNKLVMVIASVERQAYLLFEKILSYMMDNYPNLIKKGKDRPTKSKIQLKNGCVIHCLPTGLSGYGIRGFTVDLLIADEAAFIPEEVWTAVTPMLAVTKGTIILLSTPHGKEGFYYSCFNNESFTSFHVSSEDCPRKDEKFLEREKERMTKVQYAQEYLGEFVDELMQFFSTETINKCLNSKIEKEREGKNYLGVDIARMGADETALVSLNRLNEKLKMFEIEITKKTLLPETTKRIINADLRNNYSKIYVDDGGLGVGVFDALMEDEQTKRKTIGINNARRSIDRENGKKKLMKEDLYTNLLNLMEKGKIEIMDNPEIVLSLKSIQYEYTDEGRIKIFGNYSHITEALVRAAWCVKDKTLNIYVYT